MSIHFLLLTTFQNTAFLPNLTDYVEVGDICLFRFDHVSRKEDLVASGYSLPLHIGKVKAVLNSEKIEVAWFFGDDWRGTWMEWRDPRTKQVHKQVMDTKSIITDSHNVAAKLKFEKTRAKWKLTAQSIELILEVLSEDQYTSNSSCAENSQAK